MGAFWKSFEMPKQLVCDESTATATYAKFVAEPFERGYGVTTGNSLRRVLISSIEGAAVTSVKIENALHEFSTVEGVVEDLPQIILNLKKLIIRSHSKEPKIAYLRTNKKGPITGKDIETDESIEIINPDLHIATLTKAVTFNMEMVIQKGRGYIPADRLRKEEPQVGVIPIDAAFSPVTRVNFWVENTRVGQMTDYDKLILEIWTNGSIMPKDALLYASNIFQRHLDVFVNFGKLPEEEAEVVHQEENKALLDKLGMPITELELSVRSANCLRESKIKTIGDLVVKSEAEMLKYRNFGKKSLNEIVLMLNHMGLSLGMKIEDGKIIPQTAEEDNETSEKD